MEFKEHIEELRRAIAEKRDLIAHYQGGARVKQKDSDAEEWRDVTDEKIASLKFDVECYEDIIRQIENR